DKESPSGMRAAAVTRIVVAGTFHGSRPRRSERAFQRTVSTAHLGASRCHVGDTPHPEVVEGERRIGEVAIRGAEALRIAVRPAGASQHTTTAGGGPGGVV